MEPIPGTVIRAMTCVKISQRPWEDPTAIILLSGHNIKLTPNDLLLLVL